MNLNQSTLSKFENERKSNNFIPPIGSNSFYTIGNGRINLMTAGDQTNYRFDIFTESGTIRVGDSFNFAGDINNPDLPYRNLTIIDGTEVINDGALTISKGEMIVHGSFIIESGSHLVVKNGAKLTFYTDSEFTVKNGSHIIVDEGCSIQIYGHINIHLDSVDTLLKLPGVVIDSAAVMNVDGLSNDRLFSVTDYCTELSNRVINKYTQGEKSILNSKIGYEWVGGDPINHSQLIKLSTIYGEVVLGDFTLSILGTPIIEIPNFQAVASLTINKSTVLNITSSFKGYRYVKPELYIGMIIGNDNERGSCIVDGTIIVDGPSSMITVDRGGTLTINEGGEVYLRNGAILRSTYNDGTEVLFINGKLVVDDISQINTFSPDNIRFGENGKVVILNPDTGEPRVLLSTPNGIKDSELYRLFLGTIEHVEYHISNNTGIRIDKYYEFYSKDFTNWYAGCRIEKAVHDGLIVWHDGAFIELDHSIIPWVTSECSLLQASRIFKTFGSYDDEKLQDAVNRLRYAGFGNITFRFIYNDKVNEVVLILDGVNMKNSIYHPVSRMHIVTADNDGELFLKNNLSEVTPENIITKEAKMVTIRDKKAQFSL